MSTSRLDRRQNPYMPRDNVIDNEGQAARPYCHSLKIKDSPHVLLSCSTGFPHKIKFRKRVTSISNAHQHLSATSTSATSDRTVPARNGSFHPATDKAVSLRMPQVNVWPFCFVARVDYSRIDRGFQYGCSCRVRGLLLTVQNSALDC